MAAPTTQQSGYSYVVKVGGTAIGGGTNATLSLTNSFQEATNKGSSRWKKAICGIGSWSISDDGMYLVSTAEVCGKDVVVTAGSANVKGIKQMNLAFSAAMLESANASTSQWMQVIPGNRTLTVTLSGDWYDFDLDTTAGTGGDEALEDIFDAYHNNTTVSLVVGLVSTTQSIAATSYRVLDATLGFPHDGIIPYSVTLEANGAPGTFTQTSADAVLAGIVGDFVDAAGVQSATVLLTDGTTDDAEWTGTAYPETINLSVPFDGPITASVSYKGSGALTQADAT